MSALLMMNINEISSNTFELHTDSVEFSPSGLQALVGSYELNETTEERSGNLTRYNIISNQVEKSEECSVPGVLDLSWMTPEICLAATSSGEIYTIRSELSHPITVQGAEKVSENLLLSLDYKNNKIVTSDRGGYIYLIDSVNNDVISTWRAHSYEAWCVRFNRNDDNLVLTGGDDFLSKVWDQRMGFFKPVSYQKHEVGVCSLSGIPMNPQSISSGCYDDKLRLWDIRAKSQEINEGVVLVQSGGGGIWRHKWSPGGRYLLMACMHTGFAVTKFTESGFNAPKTVSYRPDAKLAYGVDWQVTNDAEEGFEALIGACSFYDNHVSFATFNDSTGV